MKLPIRWCGFFPVNRVSTPFRRDFRFSGGFHDERDQHAEEIEPAHDEREGHQRDPDAPEHAAGKAVNQPTDERGNDGKGEDGDRNREPPQSFFRFVLHGSKDARREAGSTAPIHLCVDVSGERRENHFAPRRREKIRIIFSSGLNPNAVFQNSHAGQKVGSGIRHG